MVALSYTEMSWIALIHGSDNQCSVFRRHLNHLRTRIADLPPKEQDTDEWSYYEPEEQTESGSVVSSFFTENVGLFTVVQ